MEDMREPKGSLSLLLDEFVIASNSLRHFFRNEGRFFNWKKGREERRGEQRNWNVSFRTLSRFSFPFLTFAAASFLFAAIFFLAASNSPLVIPFQRESKPRRRISSHKAFIASERRDFGRESF